MPLHIVRNDITTMKVDAIVNAAKESLLGGGGVDGAIHRAAGPELLAECRTLGGCKTGQAKITKGYRLPAKFVIHTVGPIWRGGSHGERELLVSAYRSSLEVALSYQCETVAFPLISSGVYGYPKDQALKVAVDTIGDFLLAHDMTVYLVIFDRVAYTIGGKLFADIAAYIDDRYVDTHTDSWEIQRRRMAMASIPMEEAECAPAPCTAAPSGLDEALSKLDESFSQMLLRKIDECGMTDAQCYKKSAQMSTTSPPSPPPWPLPLPWNCRWRKLGRCWGKRALPFLTPASSILSWSISSPTGTTTSSKSTRRCSPLTRACWEDDRMQDNYVGDIGDYGKYGLLRNVTATGLRLAVNWYRVIPTRPGKQEDGKYTSYLDKPEIYRHYDPELFDCLANIVHRQKRSIEEIEASGVLTAAFFSDALVPANRSHWHQAALASTIGTDIVFLDPDNGLETAKMHERRSAKEKHTTWQEVKDYYDRGQSVILYQHRPQMTKKEMCIQSVLGFQNSFLHADHTLLLEYPRYTNRYYFIFAHQTQFSALEHIHHKVAQTWKGLCNPVDLL